MMYCPHCQKPTARTGGACPHCGQPLAGKTGSVSTPPESVPTSPSRDVGESEPRILRDASAGPRGSSGLELDYGDDIPDHAVERAERRGTPALGEMAGVDAGFGKPGAGPIGAIRYWLRVRKRLGEIGAALRAAEAEENAAQAGNERALAALGRGVHAAGVSAGNTAAAVREAAKADASMHEHEARSAARASAAATETAAVEQDVAVADAAARPYREAEQRLLEKQRALAAEQRGCDTNLKRYRIELENTEALVAQKRAHALAGQQNGDSLIEEIDALSARREAAEKKIVELRDAAAVLDERMAAIASQAADAARAAAPFVEKCDALRDRKVELEKRAAAEAGASREALEVEVNRVQSAWAEAGRAAVRERVRHPELEGLMNAAVAAARRLSQASSEAEELRVASEGFDTGTVRTAQMVLVVAAVASAALLAMLIVWL